MAQRCSRHDILGLDRCREFGGAEGGGTMEWTRPGIKRHFDFQGKAEKHRKRYMITLAITNKDPERNLAVLHLPFEQDGWAMEVPGELSEKVMIEGLKVEEEAESWTCRIDHVPAFVGEHKGLVLHSTTLGKRCWGAYLEPGQTATITFEALVASDEPLIQQTLTLRYFPDLGWLSQIEPKLAPSLFYSSNLDLEKGHLA